MKCPEISHFAHISLFSCRVVECGHDCIIADPACPHKCLTVEYQISGMGSVRQGSFVVRPGFGFYL